MAKILVVEDFWIHADKIKKGLLGKVDILMAETIEAARTHFQANPDIDLIIMDACVPGHKPNTMGLVKEFIDSGFSKPIIACSTMYEQELMRAGATHRSEKDEVAHMALDLLRIR